MSMTVNQIAQAFKTMDPAELELVKKELAEVAEKMLNAYNDGKVLQHNGHEWAIVDPDTICSLSDKPGLKRNPLPDVPNVLNDGRGNVPTIAPVSAVMAAGYSANGKKDEKWRGGAKVPTYTYKKPQSLTQVELRPPKHTPEEDHLLSKDEMSALWSLILGKDANGTAVAHMSPLIGDVVMAMLMQYLGAPCDALGWQWITAERILEYRGIQKKTKGGYAAGHQANELDAIATCIRQLENFWVKTQEWKDEKKLYSYHSRFLLVKARLTQTELSEDASPDAPSRIVAWQFQPGDWFIAFRDGTRRKFAAMFAQCLQYDPYHELWESRLSKYFTIHLRIDAGNGSTLTRRVSALVEELSLPIDTRHPERTFQQFTKAMDHMVKDGIIAKWQYQDKKFVQNRKARGWLPDWLNQLIVVTASEETAQQYGKIAAKVETRRKRAEAFKTAKAAKKNTQERSPNS